VALAKMKRPLRAPVAHSAVVLPEPRKVAG
jgi:hypothetical protein